MKRALWNVLAVAGLLLMIASFAWGLHRQAERPAARAPSRTAQPPAAVPKPFAVVVLDPGHGGQDSGAMCGGVMEKDLTLDVARRIDRLLDSEGIATLMTRLGDTYVSLADRAAFANRVTDCIFVSIHFNEDNKPVATGVETNYAAHQITAGSFLASWLPFHPKPKRCLSYRPACTCSHQSRCSRYQRTVSRSPLSNVWRGAHPSSRRILPASIA